MNTSMIFDLNCVKKRPCFPAFMFVCIIYIMMEVIKK